jgi:uncharacterized protein with von Willebrand factor type A (vWA) domain
VFIAFFYAMRARGVPVTPTEWLTLMQALGQGLALSDLVRLYHLARAICVKSEHLYDAYDQAWLEVFRGIETPQRIRDEVLEWLNNPVLPREPSDDELAMLEAMDLDALRAALEQRLAEQTERHDGGDRWIGTGGTSPFGHGGMRPGGIRMGGPGGGGMAAQIAARRSFEAYRTDRVLDTRQIGVALRKLRHFAREGARLEVDLEATVHATARNAGEIEVVERPERDSHLQVLLLMDSGGSMTPWSQLVSRLFSAASRASHFERLEACYFHNCVYEHVYRDLARWEAQPVEQLIRTLGKDVKLILVGDACMAPSELTARWGAIDWGHRNDLAGIDWLRRLAGHFDRSAWLNPMRLPLWRHPTVDRIGDIFPMFELTVDGIEQAMRHLSGQRVEPPEVPEGAVRGGGLRHPNAW